MWSQKGNPEINEFNHFEFFLTLFMERSRTMFTATRSHSFPRKSIKSD